MNKDKFSVIYDENTKYAKGERNYEKFGEDVNFGLTEEGKRVIKTLGLVHKAIYGTDLDKNFKLMTDGKKQKLGDLLAYRCNDSDRRSTKPDLVIWHKDRTVFIEYQVSRGAGPGYPEFPNLGRTFHFKEHKITELNRNAGYGKLTYICHSTGEKDYLLPKAYLDVAAKEGLVRFVARMKVMDGKPGYACSISGLLTERATLENQIGNLIDFLKCP